MSLDSALQYAALGWRVFPCRNKRPLTNRGCKDAVCDEATIQAWWQRWPDAQVAIATGPDSGIWVLDVDAASAKGRDGHESLRLLETAYGELDDDTPTVKTPSGGSHYYFAWPSSGIVRNTVDELGKGLDTRGDGGYVIAPDSPGYDWETDIDGVPEAPQWLLDKLAKPRTPVRIEMQNEQYITEGTRNQSLARIAGVVRAVGCREYEITALLRAVNSNRCSPPIENDDEIRAIATSIARYEPDQAWQAAVECWHLQDLLSDDVTPPAQVIVQRKHEAPGPIPRELLNPGGILQGIIDYTIETSLYPQPVGALAMAITVIGTLASRKYATQTDLRSNIYTVFLCESGGGKEHARKVCKDLLMSHAETQKFLGAEGIASDAAICSQLGLHGARLFLLDEMGRFIRGVADTSGKTPPHLANIAKVMMELYSKANQYYIPKAYANPDNSKVIEYPACCIYGTTVPESLFDGLTTENIVEGLVGRFLYFRAEEARPERNDDAEPRPVPKWLSEAVGELAYIPGDYFARNAGPQHILRDTPTAKAILTDFRTRAEAEADASGDLGERAIWNRAGEASYKLALIHAVSLGTPDISEVSAIWGTGLAEHCIRLLLHEAEGRVWENHVDRDRKRVLDKIRKAGDEGISHTQLARECRWLRAKELTAITDELIEQEVVTVQQTGGATGRKGRIYRG